MGRLCIGYLTDFLFTGNFRYYQEMKEEREQIKAVALTLSQAHEAGWVFITLGEIAYQTEIEKQEVLKIFDLLKIAGFFNYEFMPFDNPRLKHDIFQKNDDIQDPQGAILLHSMEDGIDFDEIKQISVDDVSLDNFLKRISYKLPHPSFEKDKRLILYKDKEIKISAGNQTVICELLFKGNFGDIYNESDIVLPDYRNAEKKGESQAISNSVWQINEKFEKATGISKLVRNRDGKIWLEINTSLT